jgi:hypothetical protein
MIIFYDSVLKNHVISVYYEFSFDCPEIIPGIIFSSFFGAGILAGITYSVSKNIEWFSTVML